MTPTAPVDRDANKCPTLQQIVQCGKLSGCKTLLTHHVGSIRPLTSDEQALRAAEARE